MSVQFHGQTVDIWEDFEDTTLATGLTQEGTSWVFPSTDCSWEGSASAKLDLSSITTQNLIVYGTSQSILQSTVGVCIAIRIPVISAYLSELLAFFYGTAGYLFRIFVDYTNGTSYRLRFNDAVDSLNTYLDVTVGSFYCIAYQFNYTTGVIRFNVYDASHTLLLSSSFTTTGISWAEIIIGPNSSTQFPGIVYFDDFAIDYTNGLFPILAWDTSSILSGSGIIDLVSSCTITSPQNKISAIIDCSSNTLLSNIKNKISAVIDAATSSIGSFGTSMIISAVIDIVSGAVTTPKLLLIADALIGITSDVVQSCKNSISGLITTISNMVFTTGEVNEEVTLYSPVTMSLSFNSKVVKARSFLSEVNSSITGFPKFSMSVDGVSISDTTVSAKFFLFISGIIDAITNALFGDSDTAMIVDSRVTSDGYTRVTSDGSDRVTIDSTGKISVITTATVDGTVTGKMILYISAVIDATSSMAVTGKYSTTRVINDGSTRVTSDGYNRSIEWAS
jgi:hypothetical protein